VKRSLGRFPHSEIFIAAITQGLRTKITEKVLMVNQSGGLSLSNRAQSVPFGRMMDGKMIF